MNVLFYSIICALNLPTGPTTDHLLTLVEQLYDRNLGDIMKNNPKWSKVYIYISILILHKHHRSILIFIHQITSVNLSSWLILFASNITHVCYYQRLVEFYSWYLYL